MKLAIVHEYLTKNGGAERVLDQFLETFKSPVIFTFVYSEKGTEKKYKGLDIRTSFLQKYPGAEKKYHRYIPLMPQAAESFNLDGFDVVISNSHSFGKGVITSPETLQICYCHTPVRYLWHDRADSMKKFKGLKGKFTASLLPLYRNLDLAQAERPDYFVSNSKNVAKRVMKYYGKKSDVIYPPVDTDFFKAGESSSGDYFLLVSRLEPHKKVDLAIKAFRGLKDKLKIIGTGSEEKRLKRMAQTNVEFLGHLSDNRLKEYYERARAFIFPQEEDFGITPLEAASAGKPTIAYGRGGAKETVIPGLNGSLFERQTVRCFKKAVQEFKEEDFDKEKIRKHALKFSNQVFRNKWKEYVYNKWQEYNNK